LCETLLKFRRFTGIGLGIKEALCKATKKGTCKCEGMAAAVRRGRIGRGGGGVRIDMSYAGWGICVGRSGRKIFMDCG